MYVNCYVSICISTCYVELLEQRILMVSRHMKKEYITQCILFLYVVYLPCFTFLFIHSTGSLPLLKTIHFWSLEGFCYLFNNEKSTLQIYIFRIIVNCFRIKELAVVFSLDLRTTQSNHHSIQSAPPLSPCVIRTPGSLTCSRAS